MLEIGVHDIGADFRPGSRLGTYSLLMPIGEGGMGRVWLASEVGAEHYVAVKTSRLPGEEFWSALLDEARIASRIHHPNVCAIHTADHEDGVIYLVMDWSDGASLRELLDVTPDKRLPHHLAARIASRVASGLHAVHQVCDDDGERLGVIHRDVSPQNILISTTGQVRLTDFGIAKARGRINAPTQTGQIKGKFSYMSPEQAKGAELDGRADVFALGCVLYEMTTGRAPFRGDDAVATMYQLLEKPLAQPSTIVPNYPLGLQAIIIKALAKDREERFSTAEEFARALENFLVAESVLLLDEELGELIQSTFPEQIRRRRQGINDAAGSIDRYVITAGTRGPGPQPDSSPTLATAVHSWGQEAITAATPISTLSSVQTPAECDGPPSAPKPLDQKPPRSWMLMGTLALAAAALVVSIFNRPQQQAMQSSPPSELVANPEHIQQKPWSPTSPNVAEVAKVTEPQEIALTLSAKPKSTRWYIDNGPALSNPIRLELTRDEKSHTLRAEAAGYIKEERKVTFDRNHELSLVLTPQRQLTTTKAKPSPQVAAAASSVSRPSGSQTAPSQAPSTAPTTGKAPRKDVRKLDPENPFRALDE